MFSITLKMMRKNLRMLIPAGIAIMIGTAFIAATFLFGNALNASMGKNATAGYGGANYVVGASEPNSENSYTSLADLNLDQIRAVPGVEGARPEIASQISVSKDAENSVSTTLPMASDARLMPLELSKGAWPADGQIAITQETADRLKVGIGDSVTVSMPSRGGAASADESVPVKEKIVGITTDPNGAYSYSAGASVLGEQDFFAIQGLEGHMDQAIVSNIYLMVETQGKSEASVDETLDTVEKVLPSGFEVMSRQKAADQAIQQIGQGQNVITTFLLVFGVIALLVAALVIANTFQVLVAQRRRTLALLRTIGAKKSQLYRSVLLEAFLLGFVASALGVVLAGVLMQILSMLHIKGLTGSDFEVVLDWRVVVIPLVFGIVMTIFASLSSARMATSVTPLEALRPLELSQKKKSGVVRALLSIAGIFAGGAFAAIAVHNVGLMSDGGSRESEFMIDLGMAVGGGALLFLGLILSAVWWMPVLMRGAGRLASACGPASKIAASNVAKNPRRVAATGVALLIGVTLVTAISTGAASAKQTLSDKLSQNYAVDVQISGGSLDSAALAAVKKTQGISSAALLDTSEATAQTQRTGQGSTTDLTVGMVGITGEERKDLVRADVATSSTDGVVVMNETLASGKENPYHDGDAVTFTLTKSDGSTTSVELSAVLKNFDPITGTQITAFVEPSVLSASSGIATQKVLWGRVGGSVSAVQLVSDLQDDLAKYPGVSVSGPFAEREMWETSINVIMATLIGLLAVSVIIALIGVANTLSLSVIERTRESATLRAIGMTRRQLRTSLGVEALIIAVVSGLAGLVLGIGFGWLGSQVVLSTIGSVSFRIDVGMCAAVMGIAIVAALVSSIAPARRAVKTPPVEALAEA